MNTVIDSGKWTGASSEPLDPYAVLTGEERTGRLQFDASDRVYFVGVIAVPLLFGIGLLLVGLEVADYHATGRRAEIINIPLLKVCLGFLAIGTAWLGYYRWRERLAGQKKIAPLIINDLQLRFGSPQRIIPWGAIRDVSSTFLQKSSPQLASDLSYYAGLSQSDRIAALLSRDSEKLQASYLTISLKVDGEADPFQLDLPMLEGYAPRIALIICDRVQKHQSLAGTTNG